MGSYTWLFILGVFMYLNFKVGYWFGERNGFEKAQGRQKQNKEKEEEGITVKGINPNVLDQGKTQHFYVNGKTYLIFNKFQLETELALHGISIIKEEN